MKKYKIIENHSGVNGDYVVKTYTDSFAQAVNIHCISPQLHTRKALLVDLHSCLATNKQILLKDEIKQIKLRIEDNGY